jgi:hypothetical protein
MQYFGRNSFIMNILQTTTTHKPVKNKGVIAGQWGGHPGERHPNEWEK